IHSSETENHRPIRRPHKPCSSADQIRRPPPRHRPLGIEKVESPAPHRPDSAPRRLPRHWYTAAPTNRANCARPSAPSTESNKQTLTSRKRCQPVFEPLPIVLSRLGSESICLPIQNCEVRRQAVSSCWHSSSGDRFREPIEWQAKEVR